MESRTEVISGREHRADQDQPGKFLLSKNILFGTSRIIKVSVMLVKLLRYLKYVYVTFLQMLSILCDSIEKCVQAFDDCVVHAFHGTTIQQLTFKFERQPKLVRNAAFVLLRVGTNDVCYRTRSPAIIHQLFELLVNQILSIVPNARILISSILPRLRDFDETNDKIHSINNDLEHNSISHTVFFRTCGPFLRGGRPRDEKYRDRLHLTARGILLLTQVWITKYKQVQRRRS